MFKTLENRKYKIIINYKNNDSIIYEKSTGRKKFVNDEILKWKIVSKM